MEMTGQSVNNNPRVQYNSSYGCGNCVPVNAQTMQTVQNQNAPSNCTNPVQSPQVQAPATSYQIPASSAGVNIQIFNPSVTPPGANAPSYNVNAPCYYPPNYYTGQIGANNGGNGTQSQDGKTSKDENSTTNTTTVTNTENKTENKKTEKRKIVQLTDEYIKNLENYLNSQDKKVRLAAAKEVYARLAEDDSRKNDKALTALINKMLQDPSQEVRFLALSALDGRIVEGDNFTVGVLQNMQNSKDGYGQDALDANKILLKMSGKEVEKEFPAKEKNDNKK